MIKQVKLKNIRRELKSIKQGVINIKLELEYIIKV